MSISLSVLMVHNPRLKTICKKLCQQHYRLIDFIYSSNRVLNNYNDLDLDLRRLNDVIKSNDLKLAVSDLNHINLLKIFGMTPSIYQTLTDAHLTQIDMLKKMPKETYDIYLKRESKSVYEKTQRAIKKFENAIINNPTDVISFVIVVIHKLDGPIDQDLLIKTVQQHFAYPKQTIYQTLDTLVQDEILVKSKKGYYVKTWHLKDVLDFDFLNKEAYLLRLKGQDVRTIGKQIGVSRTSVLTYVTRINRDFIPELLEENKYGKFIQDYGLQPDTLKYVFQLDSCVVNYLYEKFNTTYSDTQVATIVHDNVLTKSEQNRLLKIEKKFLNTKQEVVYQNNVKIFEDVLYRHRKKTFSIESFYEVYLDFLKTNDTIDIIPTDIRRFESIVDESPFAIKSIKRQFRYFDINIPKEYIKKINDILNPLDGSYGLQRIFDIHIKTMTEIGLKNGHELGNLINKIGLEHFPNVHTIIRISTIQLGCRSHHEFIEDKLLEFSNQPFCNLLNHLYDEFGLQKETISTNVSSHYGEYIFDGYINIEREIPKDEKFYEQAKKILDSPIYLIKDLLKKLAPLTPIDLVPSKQLFDKLGFTTKGSALIYEKSFRNVYEAFQHWIMMYDIFSVDDSDIFKVQQWYAETYRMERDLQLFKLDENHIIHFSYLKQKGITKEMLEDFIEKVIEYTKSYKYFTIPFIKNLGFKHPLLEKGLPPYTIDRILATRDNIYAQSFNSPIIYSTDHKVTSKTEVLKDVYKANPMSIEQLKRYLDDTYGIEISKDELKYRLSSAGVHFH